MFDHISFVWSSDPALFCGVKIQCLAGITISSVWIVLCRLLNVFTSTVEVVENTDSKAMSLIHCLELCELRQVFLIFPDLQFLHLWNGHKLASVSWGQWIICKALKIVLMYDKHLISLCYTRRKRKSYSIWSPQSPCKVGWARIIKNTLFLRKSTLWEN